jgi:RNA-binding protein YlmH
MITINNKIKCDACGKFIKSEDRKTIFIPDSYYTTEQSEDFDLICFEKYKKE